MRYYERIKLFGGIIMLKLSTVLIEVLVGSLIGLLLGKYLNLFTIMLISFIAGGIITYFNEGFYKRY
jgi:hypothetical protein